MAKRQEDFFVENILKLSNGVKVEKIGGEKILIVSDFVKILLDNNGNLIYVENLAACKDQGIDEKVEISMADDMRKVVSNLLHEIGIPAHIKGFQYLRTAILLAYDDDNYLNSMVKKLYPEVSKIHNTTPGRTERAIRHAIEVAWRRGNTHVLDELFASSIDPERGKATNSEFIATIVEKLKNK